MEKEKIEETIKPEETEQLAQEEIVREDLQTPPETEPKQAKAKVKAKPKPQAQATEEAAPAEAAAEPAERETPAPRRRGRPKGSLNKKKARPVLEEAEDDESPVERSSYQNPPERTISAIASLLQDFEMRQAARQTKRSQFY